MTNAKDLKWSKLDTPYNMPEIYALVKEAATGFIVFGYFAENMFVVKDYDASYIFEFNRPPYYYIDLELPQ